MVIKLDDRLEEHKDNMKNIRKGGKVIGVKEWQMGSTYNAQLPNHQLGKTTIMNKTPSLLDLPKNSNYVGIMVPTRTYIIY